MQSECRTLYIRHGGSGSPKRLSFEDFSTGKAHLAERIGSRKGPRGCERFQRLPFELLHSCDILATRVQREKERVVVFRETLDRGTPWRGVSPCPKERKNQKKKRERERKQPNGDQYRRPSLKLTKLISPWAPEYLDPPTGLQTVWPSWPETSFGGPFQASRRRRRIRRQREREREREKGWSGREKECVCVCEGMFSSL